MSDFMRLAYWIMICVCIVTLVARVEKLNTEVQQIQERIQVLEAWER